jgi:hypothetical protein
MPAATAIYAATIFTSAFLLFLVQPLMGKQVLPWFGGTASVWTVCMVFFQVALLAGYAYADTLVRRSSTRTQVRAHALLLVVSLATLPVVAQARWKPEAGSDPTLALLGLLVATIGLPYFLLSSTGPLLQAWLARAPWAAGVYRLFSLSNLASLLALLAYPVLIEPHWPLRQQVLGWSVAYAAFVALCVAAAAVASRLPPRHAPSPAAPELTESPGAPSALTQALWLVLPALGTWLLLAVTNQITQDVASIPFLWVLPLAAYLLTFILCFESDRWYRRRLWLPLAALLLVLASWGLVAGFGSAVRTGVPLYVGTLFVLCMVLHGETALRRPGHAHLTRYYLLLSAGGALGGVLVGLVAPLVLPNFYELGMGLVACAALAAALAGGRRDVAAVALALTAWCGACLWWQVRDDVAGARVLERNFYGTLQTFDDDRGTPSPHDDRRVLLHGSVKHGDQFLDPQRRREPTAYYGRTSGIGRVLLGLPPQPARVGLVGLGAGTLATYGRPGDVYRLYEINPRVFALARSEFSFLADSAATLHDVPGDARLVMDAEAPQRFDVLAVDAFSGGAIPVHLITAQAFAVYLRHLAPQGVLAFHVTNRFLDLPPVVVATARAQGLHAMLVHDEAADDPDLRRTDWVLVARDASRLQPFAAHARVPNAIAGLRPWTDDDHNLLAVLK